MTFPCHDYSESNCCELDSLSQNKRYQVSPNECCEWYQGYNDLKYLMNPSLFGVEGKGNAGNKFLGTGRNDFNSMEPIPEQEHSSIVSFPPIHEARVLILGCGNSSFAQDMRHDGWTGRMTSLDFSDVVIDQQRERSRHVSPKMEFVCHDLTTGLPFPNESFDLIIAKATFDAILTGPTGPFRARHLVQEVVRCLAPGHGIFFMVTNGNPDSRLVHLEHQNELYYYWNNVRHQTVQNAGAYRSKNVK